MKKNNIFTFSISKYIIRFGIIEIILMILSIIFMPILIIPIFFLSLIHFNKSLLQTVTLDPFQITYHYKFIDKSDLSNTINETIEKYYYINKIKKYKINYMFITIYGDIDYRKKKNNDLYEEKNIKIKKIRIHRIFNNEKEFIESLSCKL